MLTEHHASELVVREERLSPRIRWLLFTAIGSAILLISTVMLLGREPPVIYAFSVHEALARHARGEPHEHLRISGDLVPGSLIRSDQFREVSFQMRSPGFRDQLLFVRARCVVPISGRDAQRPVELRVEGRWSVGEGDAHFAAERVWVVHSKYEMIEPALVPEVDGGRVRQ
jgi:cytochrome c-type biogenesis protein CcmE